MPVVWPSVAIVDGSKAIARMLMFVARMTAAMAQWEMAVV